MNAPHPGHPPRPHPRLVRVQAPSAHPLPAAAHPDDRLSKAILAARKDGYERAERECWPRGWRAGIVSGLLAGLIVGALAMHAWHELAAMMGGAP